MGQHPMYGGGYPPQMHFPYSPYYNVPYPGGRIQKNDIWSNLILT